LELKLIYRIFSISLLDVLKKAKFKIQGIILRQLFSSLKGSKGTSDPLVIMGTLLC